MPSQTLLRRETGVCWNGSAHCQPPHPAVALQVHMWFVCCWCECKDSLTTFQRCEKRLPTNDHPVTRLLVIPSTDDSSTETVGLQCETFGAAWCLTQTELECPLQAVGGLTQAVSAGCPDGSGFVKHHRQETLG